MRTYRYIGSLLAILLLGATHAAAQDKDKVGVVMGYPASVGVIFPVTGKIAVRPELSLSGASSSATGSAFVFDVDGWTVGAGVSALFYLRTYDHLRTYFTPRVVYSHSSNTSSTSSLISSSSTTTANGITVTGSVGAQYGLGDRFGVFGEVGFGGGHSTTKGAILTTTRSTSNSWGLRSGVGVILYF